MDRVPTTTQIANNMKKIQKNKFDELCKLMPESYKEDLLSVSILRDDFYEIEDKAFLDIHKNIKLPKKTATPPSLPQQAASLGKSLVDWTSSGFSVTPAEILNKRLEICKACPEWDANGLMGTGRCKKCGCSTQAKLRMATEKCPIDKWGPVSDQLTETSTKTDEKNQIL